MVQSRLERRQLQHALDERNRAFAFEVVTKFDARRAANNVLTRRSAARTFTDGFVRQQNTMTRQLQLGILRRRRQDEMMQTAVAATAARAEQERWKARAAAEAQRKAEAARQWRRDEKRQNARRKLRIEAGRERELDLLRLKQEQLHDIRLMLARPLEMAEASPRTACGESLNALTRGPNSPMKDFEVATIATALPIDTDCPLQVGSRRPSE